MIEECLRHSDVVYNLAGRVYGGVPAPINLKVPPYRFDGDTTIVIGEDQAEA